MSVKRPSEPVSYRPRGTSEVSLHERFSRVLVEQQTPGLATFDPILLQHRRMATAPPVVLLMKTTPLSLLRQQAAVSSSRAECHHQRRSVWTRLGWQQVTRRLSTSRPRGFWSFMNKYSWRASVTSTCRRAGTVRSRLGQLRLMRPASVGTQASAGRRRCRLTLQKGGATARKRPGSRRKVVPTKRQLDAELDDYMSLSRRRLDKQLDDYMSMSRSQLDAELDEYMSMAGQSRLLWD